MIMFSQKKRPIFMNTKASEKIKEKKKTFQRWRETCNPRDYKIHQSQKPGKM